MAELIFPSRSREGLGEGMFEEGPIRHALPRAGGETSPSPSPSREREGRTPLARRTSPVHRGFMIEPYSSEPKGPSGS